MHKLVFILLSALLASRVAGAAGTAAPAVAAPETRGHPGRVDAARLLAADAEPGSWLAHGRTNAEQRYSPLSQIDRGNVARLGLAWSFALGSKRGIEATPLVVDGVMYTTGSWSRVYAVDAASGREIWRYDPRVPGQTARKTCCDVVNRGVAVWKGRVYVGTLDGRLVALDAADGRPIWEVLTVDPRVPYTITGAPRVVKDKVIIGNGGAEFGVRGYVTAYDAASGAQLWRFFTVPGPPSRPYEHPELEWAAKTWSKNSLWEAGLGGTVWDSMAYDPELDLLYVGVGNSSPYSRQLRSPGGGDNLFLSSILALRPDTGKLVWHYQTTPGEQWDYTATQHMILADLEIGGRLRKVLMQAPKNGFFYVLDRETGELLSADAYVSVSWASHVDLSTGRPVETGRGDWAKQRAFVVPGPPGGHNWHPMSFSPRTGLVYIPTLETGWPYIAKQAFEFVPGLFNTGEDYAALARFVRVPIPFCSPSHITAWDPVARRQVWRVSHQHSLNGGLLSTAGDLVFQGKGSGVFAAYAADSGEKLWESKTGVGIMAPPISYSIGGEQFVAVMSGIGGTPILTQGDLAVENDGRLLVYKLDGRATLPTPVPRKPGRVEVPPLTASRATVDRGEVLYSNTCGRCHGFWARSSGLLPDLRHSSRAVHDSWQDIVLGGTRSARGMPTFADLLSADEVDAIHAYVIERALHRPTLVDRALDWGRRNLCVPAAWLAD